MGNQRRGRKSRAASPKRKRGESTDQSELSDRIVLGRLV
jgi:hypothetical protein